MKEDIQKEDEQVVREGLAHDAPAYDAYLAGLWQYDLEEPKLGMRKREDLEKLFYASTFNFQKGNYQAGELAYMANFTERLLQSFLKTKQEEEKKLQEEKRERTEEELNAEAQREELYKVTVNRRSLVLNALQSWLEHLPHLYYYRSKITGKPYIDVFGRVFLFSDIQAIEQAKAKDLSQEIYDLHYMDTERLKHVLYLNGMETLLFNDSSIAFSAGRKQILGLESELGTQEEGVEKSLNNNRMLRYFILQFTQILHTKVDEDNEDLKTRKNKALQQLEAQIGPQLLNGTFHFKLQNAQEEKSNFIVLTDGKGSQAIACYTHEEFIPEDEYVHKEMAFFPIAHALLEDKDSPIQGIILDPGNLNFFFNRDWLERLDRFAAYLMKQAQEKQEKNKE